MTEDQVQQLIAQWRARSTALVYGQLDGSWALKQCADDLEALLAERPQPQEAQNARDWDVLASTLEAAKLLMNNDDRSDARYELLKAIRQVAMLAKRSTEPLGSPTP